MGVGETRLHIVNGEIRERLKEVIDIWVVSQVLDDAFHRNPSSFHDGFAHHDFGISDDAVFVRWSLFWHRLLTSRSEGWPIIPRAPETIVTVLAMARSKLRVRAATDLRPMVCRGRRYALVCRISIAGMSVSGR